MAVKATEEGLSFVSTLDNSDFQSKSLQDIKLIETRLQLTGDVSGVAKYDAAVKAAVNAEIKLRANLADIITQARAQTKEFAAEIQQPASKTIFSDSVAEVQAYNDALLTLEGGGKIVEQLTAQLDDLNFEQERLAASFEAGSITEEAYHDALLALSGDQNKLIQQIQTVSDNFAENTVVVNEFVASTERTTIAVEQEIGILESLKATIASLKADSLTIVDPEELARSNAQLQEYQAELARTQNIGKVGFDETGVAIKEVGQEAEVAATKSSALENAISRATNLGNIGARAINQLSRQIIGLGVGFLSFYVGAKAIEALISYIEGLDAFTGRLDQMKQNLLALNDVMAAADKQAGAQIGNLKLLYDAATDVTKSMQDRLIAANALRDEFPAEFQNSTNLAIVNGKLKQSYDDLTTSIIANAKSAAAISKIDEIEGQNLDAQFVIDKNNLDKAKAEAQAYQDYKSQLSRVDDPAEKDAIAKGASTYNGAAGVGLTTPLGQLDATMARLKAVADQQNLVSEQQIKVNNGVVSSLTGYVTNVTKGAKSLADANTLLGSNLENLKNLLNPANINDKQQLDNIQTALQTKLDSFGVSPAQITVIKAALEQVKDLEKQYQVKADPTTTKADPGIKLLASQTSLLQNIDALKTKYASKDEDRQNQALDDINAAYTKQYNAIVAQNIKVQAYLNTHGNKSPAGSQLQIVDPNSILASESSAIGVQADINENDYIQQDIDKKKKLYADYQAYRLKVGDTIADADYSDLLKSGADFQTYLSNIQDSIDKTDTSGPMVQRGVIVKKALDETIETQKVALQALNEQYISYETDREALIGAAQTKINFLIKAGESDQALIVANELKATLETQDAQQAQRLQSAIQFTSSLLDLTKQQAKNALAAAQAENDLLYAQGKITTEVYNAVNAAIQQGQSQLNSNQVSNYLSEIGGAFTSLSTDVSKINSGFGQFLGTLGGALTQFKTLSDLTVKINANGGFLKSLEGADPKDAISLITTGLNSILSIVDNIASASAARKAAATDYYNSVITFQEQYNVALDEQTRLQYQKDTGGLFTNDFEELTDAANAYKAANAQYQQSLVALQQGQAIVGTKNVVSGSSILGDAANGAVAGAVVGSVVPVIGTAVGAAVGGIIGGLTGLFGGKKAKSTLAPLLSVYPQLLDQNGKFNESLAKTLVANNQVDDATKTLLNNTIAYYDEEQAAIDQITSALSDLVGNLGDSISDALVSAFESGSDAAAAFGTTVSGVLGKIVQQDLFDAIFGTQLAALKTQLVADSLNGGAQTPADIIADIEGFYKTAGALVPEFEAGLGAAETAGQAQGLNLFPSTDASQTTLTGDIQANLTEATGDILSGGIKGIQLNTYETNTILQGHSISFGQLVSMAADTLAAALQIEANTLRTANTLDGNLPDMLLALKSISSNTSSSAATELRAAGKYGY